MVVICSVLTCLLMFCIRIFRHSMHLVIVFFFKQKTAYEMRISDWSSDVCSSDLLQFSRSFTVSVERTLSILKPDVIAKNVVGQVVARIESAGLDRKSVV